MKQLVQNYKSGKLCVEELPIPAISAGMVLVENRFSLISVGTERTTVETGKASLIGKARARPDLVKQVFKNYQKEGLKATFEKVATKLDAPKSLGYSSAGIVVSSLDSKGMFKPGDRVACAGQDYASHAGYVSVPQNLVAHIPDGVSFENASFTTLGAIALQGVRQADPTLGESVCVIGLGLLGQITCQLLRANGCRVFGIDVDETMVELTNKMGAATAHARSDSNLKTAASNFTKGYGFDKVIITAATDSNDPILLAIELLRKKGVIVLVGVAKIEIPREPDFFRKELEFKISCSYGPGRYDANYEEDGLDYPIGYVRWTEQRNMEAFLELLAAEKLDLDPLITHVFDIQDGEKAYDVILGKGSEPFMGILLRYDHQIADTKVLVPSIKKDIPKNLNVGFIGAGSFAQSYLIPNVTKKAGLKTVVTRTGISAKSVAKKFGFELASTNADDIFKDDSVNVVFIATQHDTHAKYVIGALQAGKSVFVEKPLALNYEDLANVKKVYTENQSILMTGFNRRFAPISAKAKEAFADIGEPLIMNFRINAGFIPKDHWTQRKPGGGRILGEICHFVDLMQYFTMARPKKVYADCIDSNSDLLTNADNIAIIIKFDDGSIGNIAYVANGDGSLSKERMEIFGGSKAFVIDDFRQGFRYSDDSRRRVKNVGKGHSQAVEAFLNAVKEGSRSPIDFDSLYQTTLTTLKIEDALSTGLPQSIDL